MGIKDQISEVFASLRRGIGGRFSGAFDERIASAPPPDARLFKRRHWMLATALLLLLYYLIGGLLLHKVDDDVAFRPSEADLPPNGSVAMGLASGLLARELEDNHWVPDNPVFYPTIHLDNMPSFQRGMRLTLLQFLLEMKDQIARTRGSGGTDADLEQAFEALSYPPDRWWVGLDWPPIRASSTSYFKDSLASMRRYNSRLSAGEALFDRRADNLFAVLDRIALGLGAASATLEQHVDAHAGDWIDLQSDDVFYQVRGSAYVAYMLMAGLKEDYAELIRQRGLANVWAETMTSLEALLQIDPLVVLNSDGLFKNHLSEQGFALLRARIQLREITAILQK